MHDTPPVTPESIRASLAAGLACDVVEVRGDGHHFEALIVSLRRWRRVPAAAVR